MPIWRWFCFFNIQWNELVIIYRPERKCFSSWMLRNISGSLSGIDPQPSDNRSDALLNYRDSNGEPSHWLSSCLFPLDIRLASAYSICPIVICCYMILFLKFYMKIGKLVIKLERKFFSSWMLRKNSESRTGIEPAILWLPVRCSTHWATETCMGGSLS